MTKMIAEAAAVHGHKKIRMEMRFPQALIHHPADRQIHLPKSIVKPDHFTKRILVAKEFVGNGL